MADVAVVGGGILGAKAALAELVTSGATGADISPYLVDRFAGLDGGAVQAAAEQQFLLRHPPEEGVAAAPFGIELP